MTYHARMHVHLWLHSESLPPQWRSAELERIDAYAQSLRSLGAQVTYGHPLAPLPPPSSYVHIFGSGHWETIHWLRPHCRAIWLSPFSHTNESSEFSAPETAYFDSAKKLWRIIFSPNAKNYSSRAAITLPEKFFCEKWARGHLKTWGVPEHKIFELPAENGKR